MYRFHGLLFRTSILNFSFSAFTSVLWTVYKVFRHILVKMNAWKVRQFKPPCLCKVRIIHAKMSVMVIKQHINAGHKMISRFNIVPTNTYLHTKGDVILIKKIIKCKTFAVFYLTIFIKSYTHYLFSAVTIQRKTRFCSKSPSLSFALSFSFSLFYLRMRLLHAPAVYSAPLQPNLPLSTNDSLSPF
jgi:hypothetical protein